MRFELHVKSITTPWADFAVIGVQLSSTITIFCRFICRFNYSCQLFLVSGFVGIGNTSFLMTGIFFWDPRVLQVHDLYHVVVCDHPLLPGKLCDSKVYIYICTCMNIYMHINTVVYVYICIYEHWRKFLYVYICSYKYVQVRIYYIYIYIHVVYI